MKFSRRHTLISLCCVVIVVLSVVLVCTSGALFTKTSALTTDQIITSTLESLQASDAAFVETILEDDCDYLVYYSESTGCEYRFRSVSGQLASITNEAAIDAVDTVALASESDALTDEERATLVFEYVTNVLGDSLIGQLELESERYSRPDYIYRFKEFYDDMETGTSAYVICTADGVVEICTVKYGTIFCKKANGSIALANDTPFISEESAVQTALEFVEEKAEEASYEVLADSADSQLHATQDMHYFEVCIDTQSSDGYIVTYDVWVDVYNGEVLFYQFTQ